MDLDFAILSDGASGRSDGKLDIYGAGWDTIGATSAPVRHPRLTLVARLLVSAHEAEKIHTVDVILQAADGAELARASGETAALSDEERAGIPAGRQMAAGMVLNFENVVFPEFGSYQLILQWDGTELRAPIRLFVEQIPVDEP